MCPEMTGSFSQGSCDILVVSFQAWMGTLCRCLPSAVVQTTAHTCQAMSSAPWVLRYSRAPTHTYTPHIHSNKTISSLIWTNKRSVTRTICKEMNVYTQGKYNWILHKHIDSHTQSLNFIGNTSLCSLMAKLYSACRMDSELREGQVPLLTGWGARAPKVGLGTQASTWERDSEVNYW